MVKVFQGNDISFAEWSRPFSQNHLDLGTGDGSYVTRVARGDSRIGVVGVDTCLDHLRGARRNYPANARFVQCDARGLPEDFTSEFDRVSINFPYGSLLESICQGDSALKEEIQRVTSVGAQVEIVINESALNGLGLEIDEGHTLLEQFGGGLGEFRCFVSEMTAVDLRAFPSSWSRKLGYGRQPRAVRLTAQE